jgi:tetratricopeptide (TPR) repeat protein
MIVKDEAQNLPLCLASAADLIHEIVVVDTGSTDETREIARRAGAKVHDFRWLDDFAAARNAGIEQAAGDWIFWLDADDRIDEINRTRLRALFSKLPDGNYVYLMTYLALREMGTERHSAVRHAKLFRNDPRIRWQYRVHEQILPSVERAGGSAVLTDIVIHHLGYQDPDLVRRKLERNLRLLQLEDAEHPGDPATCFNLGRTIMRLGRLEESLAYLRRAIDQLSSLSGAMISTAYALSIEALCRLGRFQNALAVCHEGRKRFPDEYELMLAEGLVLRDLGDVAGAEACLTALLARDPGNQNARFHLARLRPFDPFFRITI